MAVISYRLASVVAAFILISHARGAEEYPLQLGSFSIHSDDQNRLVLDDLMGPVPLTLESLAQTTERSSDYGSFIASLKDQAPELFDRAVFLHHSGSLQSASFERPRALLFGRGAILAFSEDPGRLDREVEVITFDPAQARFDAAEIRFSPGSKPRMERSPPVCGACHGAGQDTRPLWQPYDIWPNAYGTLAGILSEAEKAPYKRFISEVGKPGIFSALAPAAFEPALIKLYASENFTQYVNSLNFLRIMARFRERLGSAHPARYALTAALNGCEAAKETARIDGFDIAQMFPPQIRARMPLEAPALRSQSRSARSELKRRVKAQYARYFSDPPQLPYFSITDRLDFEAEISAPARFVLENLGIEWASLTLSHGESAFSIQVPGLLPMDLGTALIAYVPNLFVELEPQRQTQVGLQWAKFDCEALTARSLAALAQAPLQLAPLPPLQERHAGSGLAAMARCTECHVHATDQRRAPFIPFDDTRALRTWLGEPGRLESVEARIRAGQMPPDSRMDPRDRAALIEALRRVSAHGPDR